MNTEEHIQWLIDSKFVMLTVSQLDEYNKIMLQNVNMEHDNSWDYLQECLNDV